MENRDDGSMAGISGDASLAANTTSIGQFVIPRLHPTERIEEWSHCLEQR